MGPDRRRPEAGKAGPAARRRARRTAPATTATASSTPRIHHGTAGPDPDGSPGPAGAGPASSAGTTAVVSVVAVPIFTATRTSVGSVLGRGNVSTNRSRSSVATRSNGFSVPCPRADTSTPPVAAVAVDQ